MAAHERWFTTDEASQYLDEQWRIKRTPRTLQEYRQRGDGPRYFKPNEREVVYSESGLDSWAQELLGEPIDPKGRAAARRDART